MPSGRVVSSETDTERERIDRDRSDELVEWRCILSVESVARRCARVPGAKGRRRIAAPSQMRSGSSAYH